jgi:hypothetical protein
VRPLEFVFEPSQPRAVIAGALRLGQQGALRATGGEFSKSLPMRFGILTYRCCHEQEMNAV